MGILFGFVPLIVYGLLAGPSVQSEILALGAATLVTLVVGFGDFKKRRTPGMDKPCPVRGPPDCHGRVGPYRILPGVDPDLRRHAAVTFASILAGVPFTLQYAREMVDPATTKTRLSPVNFLMTGLWGGIFAVNALLDYFARVFPGRVGETAALITYGTLAAGIVFTL